MGQSWVQTETAGCDLGDGRLNRRLGTMLEALGERPGKSLPTAFQDWSNTKAAYRFFSNGSVSEDKILEGHFAASALRIRERVLDIARHLVMPTAALSLIYMSFYLRLMRASLLEVAELDYVRTARAKGAGEWRLMTHHVMRNALLPVVTLLGLQFSTVLGGSVVVETIFSLPGLGQLAYRSVIQRDMNTLMGIIFLCSIIVVVVNFLTDLLYARLDSRIELR